MAEKGNIMLRKLIIISCLALAAQAAQAAQAGKVIFVAGKALAADRAMVLGAPVNEGELLTTGADGYVYVKTIDNGLFILRPNTRARIATYHVDKVNPANTRIKLELLNGVARSQSGEAVKLARQNFRFNTPVAAIGVRGTDFTVFTDANISRVVVLSGGVTVSGFFGACRPDGIGPCEGSASRDLAASQKGQLLQIQRGQASAQLVSGATLSPDVMVPPRIDEPVVKNAPSAPVSGVSGSGPTLDPLKDANLQQQVAATPVVRTPPPVVAPPPVVVDVPVPPVVVVEPPVVVVPPVVVTPPVVVVPPVAVIPERKIVWGRFQPVLNQAAQIDLTAEFAAKSQLINLKGSYALLRTTNGKEYQIPERGSVGFGLVQSEAYIHSDNVTVLPVLAQLENGQLNFDFDKRKFSTSFDLVHGIERFNMRANGSVAQDGRFSVDNQYALPNNMSADGVLSNENGGSAAYIFMGRLAGDRTANGVTYWGAK